MSVKNKFIPFDFNFNKFLKFSNIIFSSVSGIFAGFPSIVCMWSIYFSNVGKAFCNNIAVFLSNTFSIKIVLQNPNFSTFLSTIFLYFSTLLLKGINHSISLSLIVK